MKKECPIEVTLIEFITDLYKTVGGPNRLWAETKINQLDTLKAKVLAESSAEAGKEDTRCICCGASPCKAHLD
jgi:hypothetical protein